MTFSYGGLLALLGCLIMAVLPIPRRAEGVRIGLFSAILGYVFYSAVAGKSQPQIVAVPVTPELKPVLEPVAEEDRLTPIELLTDFSILRHLRRLGAVDDTEFERKKADLLNRV